MNAPLNIAVIGSGHWGRNIIRTVHSLGCLHSISLHEPHAQETLVIAKDFNVPAYSVDHILSSNHIDAVIIATPASSHYTIASKALTQGKHVFIEKPMALSTHDAQKLYDIKGTSVLMVGHLLRYHSVFESLIKTLPSIGCIQHIETRRMNYGRFYPGESVLWDFGPHDFSLLYAITGNLPHTIEGVGHAFMDPQQHDIVHIDLTFAEGITSHTTLSRLSPRKEQYICVLGTKGSLVFDDTHNWEQKLILTTKKGSRPIHAQKDEPLYKEIEHFITCIQEGQTPLTNGEEGVKITSLLERVDQHLRRT